MVINTNFSLGELVKAYSKRFVSRLYENFIMYKLYGDDIRLDKLKNR